jgi:hypothetical protein
MDYCILSENNIKLMLNGLCLIPPLFIYVPVPCQERERLFLSCIKLGTTMGSYIWYAKKYEIKVKWFLVSSATFYFSACAKSGEWAVINIHIAYGMCYGYVYRQWTKVCRHFQYSLYISYKTTIFQKIILQSILVWFW